MNNRPVTLRELRENLRAWARTRLWAQVLIGLVLGVIVGAIFGPDLELVTPQRGEAIGRWLAIPGRFFLGLIALVLVPLVMVSIVQGITGAGSGATLRRLGGRLLIFVVLTTTAASALGVVIANVTRPGDLLQGVIDGEPAADRTEVVVDDGGSVGQRLVERLPDLIVDLLPTNANEVLLERDMLAIVIIAVLLGIACLTAGRDRVRPLLDVLGAVLEVSMIVVKWAMFLAPLAVFGLMAQLVIQVGVGTIGSLAAYAGAVLLGLALLYLLFLALIATMTKLSVGRFATSVAPVQLMAFSTSSTAAVMPLSIETAVTKLGVRAETANLVIPLAATINMAGTALYQSIAILFLAQAAGVELSTAATIGIVVSVVAASIGAPGTPGVGVVILANIAAGAGIPATGLPLVLGLDRPLDMARTAVNVTGDLTACVLVDGAPEPSGD
jgi:Na+/H+-dicarboxylate symporter